VIEAAKEQGRLVSEKTVSVQLMFLSHNSKRNWNQNSFRSFENYRRMMMGEPIFEEKQDDVTCANEADCSTAQNKSSTTNFTDLGP